VNRRGLAARDLREYYWSARSSSACLFPRARFSSDTTIAPSAGVIPELRPVE